MEIEALRNSSDIQDICEDCDWKEKCFWLCVIKGC